MSAVIKVAPPDSKVVSYYGYVDCRSSASCGVVGVYWLLCRGASNEMRQLICLPITRVTTPADPNNRGPIRSMPHLNRRRVPERNEHSYE